MKSKQKSHIKDSFKSVAAAFFGVQSNKNREKDFAQGKLSHFIIIGIVCVFIFITCLIALVSFLIPST